MSNESKIGKRRAQLAGLKPHVGIIGAGLAGLRCADVLLQNGFRVTILEGRDRLGGRVYQALLPSGHSVDAGPNWIHGTNNNPIMDLARELKTSAVSLETKTTVVDEAGDLLSPGDTTDYSAIMWDIITKAFRHSNKNCSTIDPKESLWDFLKKEVIRRIPEDEADYERKRNIVFQLAESWGAFVGNHVFTQSLKFFWLEECIDGENLFCADTYREILQAIAQPAVKGAIFKYETVVKKICSTSDDGAALRVLAKGADVLEFDEIVVTAPLGWLKQHPEAFEPPLPTRLASAIRNIGYGCLEKVYISFPKAFWKTSDPKDCLVEGFCQMLSPSYALDSNPQRWNQEIVELASLTPGTSHPTLLFYMYGDQSRFLVDEVTKLDSKQKRDAFLYEWFRPYYSRLPRYDAQSPACQPVGCFATEWLRDDLAGNGSYSNFQVGLENGDADIEVLREGVPERGLWLAGEHTAPFVALGTVTGAYWSGESVGERIVKAYGREKDGVAISN